MRQSFGRKLFDIFFIIVNFLVAGCLIWLYINEKGSKYAFFCYIFFMFLHFKTIVKYVARQIGILRSSVLFDKYIRKFSAEDEVEYMVGCVRRAEEALNSKEINRLAFHNKRLTEIITTADEKGYQRKYKKLRQKLAIVGHEAKECKKRIEKKINEKCG